jgi:hypothetical protein
MKADGRIVTVKKSAVADVRGNVTATDKKSGKDIDYPLGKAYIGLNLLGFLQLGPIIEAGVYAGPVAIGLFIRFAGLGLLQHAILDAINSNDSYKMDASGISFGPIITGLVKIPRKPHRFYFSFFIGPQFLSGVANEGESWEWVDKASLLIIGGNAGFRWRFPNRFFLSLGIWGGVGIVVEGEWYYTNPSRTPNKRFPEKSSGDAYPAGGIDLSFGLEFGDI